MEVQWLCLNEITTGIYMLEATCFSNIEAINSVQVKDVAGSTMP